MKNDEKLSEFQKESIDFVGKRLKELRMKAGYTNYDNLAYEMGMSRAQYGRYENGSNITITTLSKILEFHKMSLKEFFDQEE